MGIARGLRSGAGSKFANERGPAVSAFNWDLVKAALDRYHTTKDLPQYDADLRAAQKGAAVYLLIGRRWANRDGSGTYHSVSCYVNGRFVARVPFEYGDGSAWEWTGADALEAAGYMPGREVYGGGAKEALFRYCERHEIAKILECSDVSRRRDL